MDTRNKILTPAAARAIAARPVVIVTGKFEVLRAGHANELLEARTRAAAAALLAVVLPDDGGLLPQRARAELVAALRAVDYVVLGGGAELEGLVDALTPAGVLSLEEVDERLSAELRDRVLRRVTDRSL